MVFETPGCRPCELLRPTLDDLARRYAGKEVLGEGMHFIPLWNHVIAYDTRVHEMKEQLVVLSKAAQGLVRDEYAQGSASLLDYLDTQRSRVLTEAAINASTGPV